MVKNSPANVGDVRDTGSIPGLGRFPGEGYGNPLQYSSLENPMDREAWQATVHGPQTIRCDRAYAYSIRSFYIVLWGTSLVAQLVKNLPVSGPIPRLRRFPGEGYGNPLQYSCLKNSMDRGAWWAIVHGVTTSQTPLND